MSTSLIIGSETYPTQRDGTTRAWLPRKSAGFSQTLPPCRFIVRIIRHPASGDPERESIVAGECAGADARQCCRAATKYRFGPAPPVCSSHLGSGPLPPSWLEDNISTGMLISVQVTDETGRALTNGLVEAWRVANGVWSWATQMRTDSNRTFSLLVSAATTHAVVVRRPWLQPFSTWWYPTTYFSNAYGRQAASLLWTNEGHTISNVDFQLAPGW